MVKLFDALKVLALFFFVLLVVFIVFSGNFGVFNPLTVVVMSLIAIGFIVYYVWRYKKTLAKAQVKRESHNAYLFEQIKNGNVPGVISPDDKEHPIIVKPKLSYSMVIADHHLAGFKDDDGNPATSFYDIDNKFDRGIIYDTLGARPDESLIKAIQVLEQIVKGETLKAKTTPAEIEKIIHEREVSINGSKGTAEEG